jgi:hypothetical protein
LGQLGSAEDRLEITSVIGNLGKNLRACRQRQVRYFSMELVGWLVCARRRRPRRLSAKAWMSLSPERRKSRKSTLGFSQYSDLAGNSVAQ